MDEKLHSLRLITITGPHEFHNIIEYSKGKLYLFIRTTTETLSFELSHILEAYRNYNGSWYQIFLRGKNDGK